MAQRQHFNTLSCIATPLNPRSKRPMPSYERLQQEASKASDNCDNNISYNIVNNKEYKQSDITLYINESTTFLILYKIYIYILYYNIIQQ